MGQTQNKTVDEVPEVSQVQEIPQDEEVQKIKVKESQRQICRKYELFLLNLKKFIKPRDDFSFVDIQFFNDRQKTEEDIGKVSKISEGTLRDPELQKEFNNANLNEIVYDDKTNFGYILGLNINGQNSLTNLYYEPNKRNILAFNQNASNGDTNQIYSIDCDATNLCTCTFKIV